jgi:putative nucleotidyltransferase with HDIG domain
MVDMSSASARKPRTVPPRRTRDAAAQKPAGEVKEKTPPQRAVVGPAHHNEGHGRRLTAAFEALENFPALAESRKRVLRVVTQDQPSVADMVTAIESDVALVIAVMRLANKHPASRGKVRSIPMAIDVLQPAGVETLIAATKTFDFFERTPIWDVAPERIRLHAVATQRAADRLCMRVEFPERDELLISSLLHDIGKLVLVQAYPGYPGQIHKTARTPEQRVHAERRELGIDHALVGGVMARRWGLPQPLAAAIEHHHGEQVSDEAALVRLADMLAHYAQGAPIAPDQLLAVARQVGLGPQDLREVLYELPGPPPERRRATSPCPLSGRELEVLRRLAEGKVYKQIALELGLSTSTVRTHLHNVYGKLGAVDRAQAVLIASERGWL